jgi:hypothetical protein
MVPIGKNTNMNREKIILNIIDLYKEISNTFDKLDDIFDNTDGPLFECAYKALDGYIEYASKHMGIDPDDLYWFVYDNDCGEKGLRIIDTDGKPYEISGVDCFIEYINDWYPIDNE